MPGLLALRRCLHLRFNSRAWELVRGTGSFKTRSEAGLRLGVLMYKVRCRSWMQNIHQITVDFLLFHSHLRLSAQCALFFPLVQSLNFSFPVELTSRLKGRDGPHKCERPGRKWCWPFWAKREGRDTSARGTALSPFVLLPVHVSVAQQNSSEGKQRPLTSFQENQQEHPAFEKEGRRHWETRQRKRESVRAALSDFPVGTWRLRRTKALAGRRAKNQWSGLAGRSQSGESLGARPLILFPNNLWVPPSERKVARTAPGLRDVGESETPREQWMQVLHL